jgi:uncharacterized Zn finger protein
MNVKSFKDFLAEATGLYCPTCGEYHGKDTENDKLVYCGNCGEKFKNPRGSDQDEQDDE